MSEVETPKPKPVQPPAPGSSPWHRASRWYLLALGLALFVRACATTNVSAASVGVRYNNVSGLGEEDLGPGLHWEIPGVHRISRLPSQYLFIDFVEKDMLSVRTKDNNIVDVDVSIPYRILPGHAWEVMKAGNHLRDGEGRFRFERFATGSAKDVLRSHLALLRSEDFYDTDRRLEVSRSALEALNLTLYAYHLEADHVLLRATYFRPEYEQQLAQIQLNEQTKLLNGAKSQVSAKRQELDNYTQGTVAQVSAKEQEWKKRIADLDRAYQVGSIDTGEDRAPGAARARLATLAPEARDALVSAAATTLGIDRAAISDAHLLGIKNIEAETTEYDRRVRSAADGIAARLAAEGDAMVARVQGEYESRLNTLLGSPGGRAWVAYEAAAHVQFAKELTFQSRDGIPSVYRLREFAERFMGR